MERTKSIRFDRFEIDLERRRLLSDGEQVALKSKAFNLLVVLAAHRGELVTKERLLELVWEGQFVEENNLTVHVAALRKALGEQKGENKFIVTVPGKGYQFVASVIEPSRNDEVIVERTNYQRVVIEEEIFDDSSDSEQALLPPGRSRFRWPVAAVGVLAALLVGVATTAWLVKARDPESPALLKTDTFTTPGGIPERVAISRDGRSIVYSLRRNSLDSIWLGDTESGNGMQLTEASIRIHQFLAFDPEGKNIYFTAKDDAHRVWTLMRISRLGGAVTELTAGVNSSIAVSPDGKQIAFIRRGAGSDGQSLMIVDSESGKNEKILFRPQAPQKLVGNGVSWSPDGARIAIGISGEDGAGCRISTVSVTDASVTPISDVACNSGSNLVWQADGNSLLLLSTGRENEDRGLVEISYPDGAVTTLLDGTLSFSMYCLSATADRQVGLLSQRTDTEIRVADSIDSKVSDLSIRGSSASSEGNQGVAVAPDGKLIFAATQGRSRVIMEADESGNTKQLTAATDGSEDGQVSVSSDNRYLVFESSRSGNTQIWRANRDGSSLLQLTHRDSSSEPTISPDGRSVFFTVRKEATSAVYKVSINGDHPEKVIDNASWPAITPDGRFIAYSVGAPTETADRRIGISRVTGGAPVKTFALPATDILYNRLRWSPDGRSIIYKDLVAGLWRQPIDGGAPARIPAFDGFRVYHFAFAPDGKVVFSGGNPIREIIIAGSR
jgi:DNA-binding winged helix-turn-helix (wHTH) protein/Tol biopolymer transport system component